MLFAPKRFTRQDDYLGCKVTVPAVPFTEHHEYAPSSASRWISCPGSIMMCKGIEQEQTDAMKRGTVLHGLVDPAQDILQLNDDDREQVDKSREYVKQVVSEQKTFVVHFELTLSLDKEDVELTFGTIDCVIVQEHRTVVIDFKFGRSEVEKAVHNDQLRIYSGMVLQHIVEDKHNPVSCRVFQPRLYNPESEYSYKDLDAIIEYYDKGIQECEKPEIRLVPTIDNCKWCLANNGSCPASNKIIQAVQDVIPSSLYLMSPNQFVNLYAASKVASERVKKVNKEAFNRALRGELPGYTIQERKGNRFLTSPNEVYNDLSNSVMDEGDKDLIPLAEFLDDHIKMGGIGDLKKKWVGRYLEHHPKITKKDAEDVFMDIINPYLGRHADSKQIVELE